MDGSENEGRAWPDPSTGPTSSGDSKHWVWLGLLLLPLALTWDFARFLSSYYYYHDQSRAGVEQLTAPPDPREVIVVLTGDMGRIPRSLELLRVRGSSELIISGAAKGVGLTELVNQQGASMANLQTIWKKIKLESDATSTVENALFTQELLKGRPPGRIILVTSDYHMGRSLTVFRKTFPNAEIIPYSVASQLSGANSFHFLWKTGAEYWKSLVYRLSLLVGF